MSESVDDLSVRPMKLRYDGNCRLCGARLPAGTFAVYERSRRTVRCIACGAPAVMADASAADAEQLSLEPAPTPTAAPGAAADDMRLRAPASAVIAETLRMQQGVAPRSAIARLFGRTPLAAESQSWYTGAIGELEMGRLLDGLGEGWLVIHAIPVGSAGSDIDHLVVGPAGVFTINTKHHEGARIWVGGKRMLVNGQRTDHLRNSAFEARRVAKLLTTATGRPVAVTPIVAIVAARGITVREQPVDVIVLRARDLVRWLQRRPKQLTGELKDQLTAAALDPATWGNPELPSPDLEGFAALRGSVAAARKRRQAWAVVSLLSPLAIIAVAMLGFAR